MELLYRIKESPNELIGKLVEHGRAVRTVVGWRVRDTMSSPVRIAFNQYKTEIALKLDNGDRLGAVVIGPRF